MLPPGSVRLIGRNGKVIRFPKPTDDYDDPLNWSIRRKAIHYGIILIYVGLTVSCVDDWRTNFQADLARDFAMADDELALSQSFNYIGLALGGFLFIPLAYRYGRRPIYLVSLLLQLAGTCWLSLASSKGEYRAANSLIGAGAAVAEALVPMTITDLFFIHQFATAYGLYTFAQGFGSRMGPVFAHMITDSHGGDWRWMPRGMVAALGAASLLVFFGAEESTFVPNIDDRLAAKLGEENFYRRRVSYASYGSSATAVDDEDSMLDLVNINRRSGGGVYSDLPPGPRPLLQRFALTTPTGRPIRSRFLSCFDILAHFPGVMYAALTNAALTAWLGIFTRIVDTQMGASPYNMDEKEIILFKIGPLLGHAFGTLVLAPLSDRWVVWRARSNGGVYEPEMRLWFALGGGVLVTTGAFMFGVGIIKAFGVSYLLISFVALSIGFGVCLETALTYITDCYHNMIGDALVGIIFVRNALSAIIWVGIMPWVGLKAINLALFITTAATSILLLAPIPLLIWGRKGRAATAARYKEYSLAATPPATLNRIMGEDTL